MRKKIVLCLVLMLSIFIVGCEKKEKSSNELITSDNLYTMYIEINPTIKLSFNESYKKCEDADSNNKCELKTKIVNYEFINEDAKLMYKDLDLTNKDILEVIPILTDKIYENGINANNIKITTDWLNGYNEKHIKEKIEETSDYKTEYNIKITETQEIDNIDLNKEIKSIKVTKNNILALNESVLREKSLKPILTNINPNFIMLNIS